MIIEPSWASASTIDLNNLYEILFGSFRFLAHDKNITKNRERVHPNRVNDSVFGSIFGIFDWLSENWLNAFYEIKTSFPSSKRSGFCSPNFGEEVQKPQTQQIQNLFDDWLTRHSLGYNHSDLALPNILIVPDVDSIDLLISPLPLRPNPSVEFIDSEERGIRPFEVSFSRVGFLLNLEKFVNECLFHLREVCKDQKAFSYYESVFGKIWEIQRNPERVRKFSIGENLYQVFRSKALEKILKEDALFSFILDCDPIGVEGAIDLVYEQVKTERKKPRKKGSSVFSRRFSTFSNVRFLQGYQLAQEVRNTLGNSFEPLTEMDKALNDLGVEVIPSVSSGAFRSAGVLTENGRSVILASRTDDRIQSFEGRRFALAAALGRMIHEKCVIGTEEASILALGDYCRHGPMAMASAFAAELILPKELFLREARYWTLDDLKVLAGDYGISLSATRWHAFNSGASLETEALPQFN